MVAAAALVFSLTSAPPVSAATLSSGRPAWASSAAHALTPARASATTLSLTAAERASTTVIPRFTRALWWAQTQQGCWYAWGGTGPCWTGYDCSGLVYAAYHHLGVPYFGRDTYEMLASGRLRLVHRLQPGELAFFGSGHVELYVGRNVTFGAQTSGTQVGFHAWNAYWHPTAFYYVWGS